jgi:hypothetical protein
MSWFRVDDKSAFHEKILKAGNEGWGAFCRAGASSSGQGTNGRISIETAHTIAKPKVWKHLIEVAELVERIPGSTDLMLHDYLDWNPSADEVRASIEAKRNAGRKGGTNKSSSLSKTLAAATADAQAPATADAQANAKQNPSIIPTQPNHTDQTRSLPSGVDECPTSDGDASGEVEPKAKTAKRGTRAPSSVDPAADAWLASHGIPSLSSALGSTAAEFLDYWAGIPGQRGTKLDWAGTWRNRLRDIEKRTGRPMLGNGPARGFTAGPKPDTRPRDSAGNLITECPLPPTPDISDAPSWARRREAGGEQ